jgi:lipopolysaccharide export system permease protein
MSFTTIIQIFTIIDVFRKRDLNDFYTIIKLLLLKTPYIADSILPYMIILSTIYTFNKLSKSNELTVIRSFGLSAWQFSLPIIFSFLCFMLIYITIFNPIIASTYTGYNRYKAALGGSDNNIIEISNNGIWVKDKSGINLDSYINANAMYEHGKYLTDVTLYINKQNDIEIIKADLANINDNKIILTDVTIYQANHDPVKQKSYTLNSKFNNTQAIEIIPLKSVSIWEFNKAIAKLNKAGFSTLKYKYYYYRTLFLPALAISLLIFAIPIGISHVKNNNNNYKIGFGLISAFILYFLTNLVNAMTETGSIPILVSVIIPPLIFCFLGLALIFHLEDG